MLRRLLAWWTAIAAGIVLGLLSAAAALEFGRGASSERFGAWSHSRATGSAAAGLYTRAIIAREGLLALSAREALYFNLREDNTGQPLDEACVYELAGRELDARWWSVTLYAADHYLAQNTDHAHSIDASRVRAGADGFWRVRISPVRGDAAHWISSRAARDGYALTLRVYNPRAEFRPSAEALPELARLSCAGDRP